ncbi:MAG: polyvinylalcohol dehydrogenase [Verrucomicrobia bacterium]|nr:polyvinylalcohol dehydrogenase [Verrucomicrobiota bacterium]
MNPSISTRAVRSIPAVASLVALLALILWLWLARNTGQRLALRLPGADSSPITVESTQTNAVLLGQMIRRPGQPSKLPGSWPRFRGPNLDGISAEPTTLAREWKSAGPQPLWSLDVGEGYASAAIHSGRVCVMDYDQEKRQDALRCFSLTDGQEIWRYAYPIAVKRNHGMSRTVPAVTDKYAVAMGPKRHVLCVDAKTGQLQWGIDLVQQLGATVPPGHAGQCPLLDGERLIVAVGGKEALLVAVDLETGKPVWQTPNPKKSQMTHSSVIPMEFAGRRLYVYCGSLGIVGVSAADGTLLWESSDWKISIATIPSPVILDGGKIFLSGGYNAGSMMLQLKVEGEKMTPSVLHRLPPETFGSTQHTPIYLQQHLFGVRPDGQFVCLAHRSAA